jgi:quercetin dioxygenase-like cupin family protein
MKALDALAAARAAVAANPNRPATAVIHDSHDVRLVVFRIAPGQQVPPHQNASTVMIEVLEGSGTISGADGIERSCTKGDIVIYEPGEQHGMKADAEEFLLLATISPRPASR